MTPDISARILGVKLNKGKPFFFARIGDGAVECIRGQGRAGHTCDMEAYSLELGARLNDAVLALRDGGSRVLWGDWRTAVGGSAPTYVEEWAALVDAPNRQLTNYEALLLNRQSRALVAFYATVRYDRRRKVYIGRDAAGASSLLQCASGITTPMALTLDIDWLRESIERARPEVILFGAGMGGLCAVVEYWSEHPDVTCIHLGSALDPYFGHRSRAGQLTQAGAYKLLEPIQ